VFEHQRAEIIDGTLYVFPSLAPRHANAISVLGGKLSGAFQRGREGPFDPIAQKLEVHFLKDDHRWRDVRGYEGDVPARAEPFAAIEFDLAASWVRPDGLTERATRLRVEHRTTIRADASRSSSALNPSRRGATC